MPNVAAAMPLGIWRRIDVRGCINIIVSINFHDVQILIAYRESKTPNEQCAKGHYSAILDIIQEEYKEEDP